VIRSILGTVLGGIGLLWVIGLAGKPGADWSLALAGPGLVLGVWGAVSALPSRRTH